MKILLLLIAISSFSLSAAWDQPRVLCPEEILPQGFPCPDLSEVRDVFTDFPKDFSAEDIRLWKYERSKDLKLCRYQEALDREERRPGTITPLQRQISWMIVQGGKKSAEKLEAVLRSAAKYSMPPQILLGAMTQESLLADLGISPDGGNYSCGISQLNVQEWCAGVSRMSSSERAGMGWPAVDCRSLPSTIVAPFYEIAKLNLGSRPAYMIDKSDFSGVRFEDVEAKLSGSSETKRVLYSAVMSFINNCQDPSLAIPFKAFNLNDLFVRYVPAKLRFQNTYASGETFQKSCRNRYDSRYYPLHTGWLLAVATYNAGPRQVQLLEHYLQVKDDAFPTLYPTDLIEALYWGGTIKESNKRTYYVGQNGRLQSQPFYKSCVVQRHVARVVEHVTQPGYVLARSLEKSPCSPNEIPAERRFSSGVKEN